MAKASKIPVTRRALFQRLQRALRRDDLLLKTARTERLRLNVGDYFTVGLFTNAVMDQHVDLEKMGKEYGVLHDYEALEKEGGR